MRVVIQRVSHAEVTIAGIRVTKIGKGLHILLGISAEDDESDVEWLCKKICHLRIFEDDLGKMNLSVLDIKGEIMVISQFTLIASTKKGHRPSFTQAMRPELAKVTYDYFCRYLTELSGIDVKKGVFGGDMHIFLKNYGPVTIIMDSKLKE